MAISHEETLKRKRDSQRERYANDPQYRAHRLALSRRQRDTPEYRAKHREDSRRRWKTDPAYRRRHRAAVQRSKKKLRHVQYGLTDEQFIALQKKHNKRCGICNRRRPLVIDHCHKSGKVRGLLCSRCNLALGALGDTRKAVERILKYLKHHV